MPSAEELSALVRRALGRALAERGLAQGPRTAGVHVEMRPAEGPSRPEARAPGAHPPLDLVTARDVAEVPDGGRLALARGARMTPLAREEAFRRGIRLGPTAGAGADRQPRAGEPLRVAVGADHGGFRLKGDVLVWLRELGHRPFDLGTHDESPVDYPDFAAAVARAVAEGRADLGVAIDGAGIGSAMAANKIPGVRAANCAEVAQAKNAREHNCANVLTLGAKAISPSKALEVLRIFLTTSFGEARHARRVAKLAELDRRPGAERASRD